MNREEADYESLDESFAPDPTEPKTPLEKFLQDPIQSLSPPHVFCATPKTTVAEAVKKMNEEKIGAVVVTEGGKVVGIFTERDLLMKVAGRQLDFTKILVGDYMTKNPECLKVHDMIAFAMNKMVVGGYRHIPIVDESGNPVGIVSMREIVEHLVDYFPDPILNLPPRPDLAFKGLDGG
ncbi:MAG: CBS domain-containing protein [Bdellovibrionota bacterium]